MANAHLRLVAPTTVNRTVPTPQRRSNRELRTREHLTTDEVERLIEAAKTNRHGHRDATMVLLAFRHALRAVGIRSTSVRLSCTSVGSRTAHPARTRWPAANCVLCAGSSARAWLPRSCSCRNGERRFQQRGLAA
jgi:hypothetical protein